MQAAAVDWDVPELSTDTTVDIIWTTLTNKLRDLCTAHVPLTKPGRCLKRPPWFDRELRRWMSKRKRAWKAYTAQGDVASHITYKQVRNQCKAMLRRKRAQYESELVRNAKTQPKRIYAYVSRRRKVGPNVPPLTDAQGTEVHMVELLAYQFPRNSG